MCIDGIMQICLLVAKGSQGSHETKVKRKPLMYQHKKNQRIVQ